VPTRTRKPGAVRRVEIAEAALRLAGERGLAALTMATLAAEVGLTSGALFRHFASRGEILEAAVERAVARLEATFPPPGRAPLERILELARARVALLGAEPGLAWLLTSDQAYVSLPPGAVARLGGLVGRTRAVLLESLREGAADGGVRADVACEHLLVTVVGTIHALIGARGLQRGATGGARPAVEPVLAALARLLSPPSEPPDPKPPSKGRKGPEERT